jgi:sugar phosphate isomerase/epimerase
VAAGRRGARHPGDGADVAGSRADHRLLCARRLLSGAPRCGPAGRHRRQQADHRRGGRAGRAAHRPRLRSVPHAEAAGVKLGIEPLHPAYADTRSAINTLQQANDLAEAFDTEALGVVVDVYHLWWDPDLEAEIARCGANGHLFAYHVCDWKSPTEHLLLDRGLMGEGCIPLRQIRGWVEDAGFDGFVEVEIFSETYWQQDQHAFLDRIQRAYLTYS